ncbi:peptidoglycan-binding protein [Actinacidiphila paucisporea]|uniref:Helix-turn-helix domain-containing protein n=1 Tax=Actinacidiphila paucisporea TaxID=310782 RepID=A0A1M7Q8R5_9ACTN|nr:peptidoglycan-binding protein [Actinacidiphila paucisporea]SHN26894.1 Helix-turn-helix domain-containing protein [Actinacidiphila paucisporea]
MPRWKALPSSLDERVRNLVVQMRRLKDRSGLSLASLQIKTGYSSSSWERYLSGRALPPRKAVEELARVSGVDPARLLVLHEVAEEAWNQEPAAAPVADIPETQNARRRGVLIGVCTAVVVGVVLAGVLFAAPWKDGGDGKNSATAARHNSASASRGAFAYKAGKTYPCTVRRESGRLSAGYSDTRTALLSGPDWDVVEAQCLLGYHGFDPGGVDGVIGPKTTRAVKRLQQKAGLPPDGVVGTQTWQVLRK